MTHSESIKNIMTAIHHVQQSVPPIKKESQGSTGNRGYKYAQLDSIWEAVSGALKAQHLTITSGPTTGSNFAAELFQMMVYHTESGEWISETMTMKTTKDDPQGVGSAITYYRRYMLVSMLGLIVEGDDTDASNHQLATSQQKAKIVGAVKQIFPEINSQQQIIETIQNIVGKHPSYIRENEADDAVNLIKAFTANSLKDSKEGVDER